MCIASVHRIGSGDGFSWLKTLNITRIALAHRPATVEAAQRTLSIGYAPIAGAVICLSTRTPIAAFEKSQRLPVKLQVILSDLGFILLVLIFWWRWERWTRGSGDVIEKGQGHDRASAVSTGTDWKGEGRYGSCQ